MKPCINIYRAKVNLIMIQIILNIIPNKILKAIPGCILFGQIKKIWKMMLI